MSRSFKPFTCPLCPHRQTFYKMSTLATHVACYHADLLVSADQYPVMCPCGWRPWPKKGKEQHTKKRRKSGENMLAMHLREQEDLRTHLIEGHALRGLAKMGGG